MCSSFYPRCRCKRLISVNRALKPCPLWAGLFSFVLLVILEVTGKGANFHSQIREYLTEVKKESKIPVMMGFGIRTAADVAPLEDIIDGAIVGSHFIKLLEANNYSEEAATDYVATFKKELNA